MKILIATYFYLPSAGGLNSFVKALEKELKDLGHDVDIFAHHPDMGHYHILNSDVIIDKPPIKELVSDQVDHFYQSHFPHVDVWIRQHDIERYSFELASSQLNLLQYDIIVAQDIISTRAFRRVKPTEVCLLSTLHGLLSYELYASGAIISKETLAWKYLADEEYYGVMSSDRTIVPTNWMKETFINQFGVPKEKIRVVPYGIHIPSFSKQLTEDPYPPMRKDPAKFVISCPARLVPEKGHHTLIEAASILKKKRTDFVCWIIGSGELRKELEDYCHEKNVEKHVIFLEERKDVPALLKVTDIMVLPSLLDNIPYAIMEAQIAGKAVIASAVGGIPEMIVDGKTGLLFEKGNSTQLAERILELMSDHRLREQLETNARQWGQRKWSSMVVAEELIDMSVISTWDEEQSRGEEVALRTNYGLAKLKYCTDNMVRVNINNLSDFSLLDKFVKTLPTTYCIPDTVFIKRFIEGYPVRYGSRRGYRNRSRNRPRNDETGDNYNH